MAEPKIKRAQWSAISDPTRSWFAGKWGVLVFSAAFAVNANTLTNGWALDDTQFITQNNFARQGLAGVPGIWSNDVFVGYLGQGGFETGGRYRPLSQTVFAMQYAVAGDDPFLGHLTNVLLYAFTCVLLLKLFVLIFPESGSGQFWNNAPLLASLLYVVHPLHAEVVANVKSLDEILAMFFALLSAWFALKSTAGHRRRNTLVSCLAFFLALAAKENAITFLVIVPLVIWYVAKDVGRSAFQGAVLLVPTVLYFMLRSAALGPVPQIAWVDDFVTNPFHGATAVERVATTAFIFAKYVRLLLFPWPLTTDYYPPMIPIVGWSDPRAVIGVLLALLACVLGVAGVRRRSMIGFGLIWFLATYSVVSNLFINLGTAMNDRFLFMPSAGFTLALAAVFIEVLQRTRTQLAIRAVRPVIALVLAGFALQTLIRNGDWKDDLTLFAHDVAISDRSARCHVMYAKLLMEHATGTHDAALKAIERGEAEQHLERGIDLYADYSFAWGLLGRLALDRKDYATATDHFIACLERDPTEDVALKNLAFIGRRLGEAKDYSGAERASRAVIRFSPGTPEPYLFLADALMRTGRADSAILVLDRLITIEPGMADAFRMKGEIHAVYLERPALAEENFLKAHALDPKNVSVIDNLGVAAFQRQDYPRALSYFFKGLEIQPDDERRLRSVAETYRMMGEQAKAAEFRSRAERAAALAVNFGKATE